MTANLGSPRLDGKALLYDAVNEILPRDERIKIFFHSDFEGCCSDIFSCTYMTLQVPKLHRANVVMKICCIKSWRKFSSSLGTYFFWFLELRTLEQLMSTRQKPSPTEVFVTRYFPCSEQNPLRCWLLRYIWCFLSLSKGEGKMKCRLFIMQILQAVYRV